MGQGSTPRLGGDPVSEMIERIARAIAPEDFKPWAFEDQTDLDEADRADAGYLMLLQSKSDAQRRARDRARAALEAMKVPTVEMIIRATEDWLCIRAMEDRAEIIWDAMIDEALQAPAQ